VHHISTTIKLPQTTTHLGVTPCLESYNLEEFIPLNIIYNNKMENLLQPLVFATNSGASSPINNLEPFNELEIDTCHKPNDNKIV